MKRKVTLTLELPEKVAEHVEELRLVDEALVSMALQKGLAWVTSMGGLRRHAREA